MRSASGNVVAIMGATATGKSEVAIRMAKDFRGEIVSMDSRQVYRELDIGTAKVSREDRQDVRHHLVDVLDPTETNSAGRHIRLVRRALADIHSRRRLAILTGGTGLYFRAFFQGLIDVDVPEDELASIRCDLERKSTSELYEELSRLDPDRAAQLAARDRLRLSRALEIYASTGKTFTQHQAEQAAATPGDDLRIVLTMPRPILRARIADRTRDMYRRGWVEEVSRLLAKGYSVETPAMSSLGYSVIASAIHEKADANSTLDEVVTLSQQYAKRQETFFRSIPDGRWIDMTQNDALPNIKRLIKEWLAL